MAIQTLEKIFHCIDNQENFILDAGAGSGKTWSLVKSIKYVLEKQGTKLKRNNQQIVCITYTNIAKNEIIERLENNKLVLVSTIHDFLWNCISSFKTGLKQKLIEIIDERIEKKSTELEKTKEGTKKYQKIVEQKQKLESDKIELRATKNRTQYKNFTSFKRNIISHDEVILLASKIFSSYFVIQKLTADKYPIIFVDEYQDTFPEVIEIFLKNLNPKLAKFPDSYHVLFGFFGDKMQNIYDRGVGEIPSNYRLKIITKSENYRSSVSVINLLNKIRDDIKQVPSGKNKNIQGNCCFYEIDKNNFNLDNFIDSNLKEKFLIKEDRSNLKILYLTHKLIARENGYEELYKVVTKEKKGDALTKKDEDRCPFIKFLYQIEDIVNLYQNKKYSTLLKKYSFEINSFKELNKLKQSLKELIEIREKKTIEKIIEFVDKNNILKKTEKMNSFDLEDEKNRDYYQALMEIEYKQIIQASKVVEEKTPFSTKHGTKGAEFENVIVVIDDSAWRNYNFDKYFSGNSSNIKNFNRTRNLFYVICSRAEKNLAVLSLSELNMISRKKIKDLFD